MSLKKWFKEDWVDIGSPKKVVVLKNVVGQKPKVQKRGYPKCVPASKASNMSKSQIASAVTRKRSKKQGVGGKPTNVSTFASTGGKITKTNNMGLYSRY